MRYRLSVLAEAAAVFVTVALVARVAVLILEALAGAR